VEEGSDLQAAERLVEVGEARFTILRAVGRGVGIWFSHLAPFALVTGILYSPVIAYAAFVVAGTPSLEGLAGLVPIRTAGWALLPFVAGAVLVFPVLASLRGETETWRGALRAGVPVLVDAIGVALVFALIVGIPATVLAFLRLDLGEWVRFAGYAVRLALVLVLCVVWLAVPVAAVEKPGLIASFVRSAALTKGSRLRILVILVLLATLDEGRTELLDAVNVRDFPTDGQVRVDVGVTLVSHILMASFVAVLQAVSYHDLVRRHLALEEGSR